ncbi:hypothetical protein GCM10023081_22040 [Arthrobacter ginkgonis]|uniref:DUF222 domain-containing protein n=1 Tax=Arthrobacter ginkgonis TaxID=1630594 RepID=A0ABP7CCR8_9MICC
MDWAGWDTVGWNAAGWDGASALEGASLLDVLARQMLAEVAGRAAAAAALVQEGLRDLASLDTLGWESPAGEAFRERAAWLRGQVNALELLIEQTGAAARSAAAVFEAPSGMPAEVLQALLGALQGLASAGLPLMAGT